MKKYILAINLLAILLFISSCEDIVDADNNINKKQIKHLIIKSDQEHGVLMPLKKGNLWVYKITFFNNDGSIDLIKNDTIIVNDSYLINREKWFQVTEPRTRYYHSTYLTNSIDGLNFRGASFDTESFLRAEYPTKNNTYYVGYQQLYSDYGDQETTSLDTVDSWTDIENIKKYSTPYGTYECLKYQTRWLIRNEDISYNPVLIEYYVPDLGMIWFEEYTREANNKMKICTLAELIYTNVKI